MVAPWACVVECYQIRFLVPFAQVYLEDADGKEIYRAVVIRLLIMHRGQARQQQQQPHVRLCLVSVPGHYSPAVLMSSFHCCVARRPPNFEHGRTPSVYGPKGPVSPWNQVVRYAPDSKYGGLACSIAFSKPGHRFSLPQVINGPNLSSWSQGSGLTNTRNDTGTHT